MHTEVDDEHPSIYIQIDLFPENICDASLCKYRHHCQVAQAYIKLNICDSNSENLESSFSFWKVCFLLLHIKPVERTSMVQKMSRRFTTEMQLTFIIYLISNEKGFR